MNILIVIMFTAHYINRALIYPFLIRGGKPMTIDMFLASVFLISLNGYIQGFYHAKYAIYPLYHWTSFGFLIGFPTYFAGMVINCHSDHILRHLRGHNEIDYKIPRGGAFEYVSCANYFGGLL
ncbi:3-oxo-5-alpha-steroid 4-dehydrogenase domain-containing protein [Ditylenchus destructor]|uniref:3-oxo-5-alpha-steroid 4-dehydrogenase domain-containing protein n=1 Tax=Ditylenchus destructor TaxID=166010 RepID=A0AAD4R693_9BILA|nr:3-oxo-5-alpha-steroid 4-dehydrogenase domain-containing protein [Ditylenchus destructor]